MTVRNSPAQTDSVLDEGLDGSKDLILPNLLNNVMTNLA
jgi:hypothetical protein